MATHRCEVLILGGGILGLWVLDRLLKREYSSPILLESELLGCRQTGHSDAFLHQGYAYYDKSGVQVLIDAWNAWQTSMPVPSPPTSQPIAHHVYLDANKYQSVVAWRQSPNLPPVSPAHQLNAQSPDVGIPHDAIKTDERCAPGDWIVGQLYANTLNHIRKIKDVQQIAFAENTDGSLRVDFVSVVMHDATLARFEPNSLLLCAGERNQNLLDPSVLKFPNGVIPPPAFTKPGALQRATEMEMLVARDPTGALPEMNGSIFGTFPDQKGDLWTLNLFVVSRSDLGNEQIWLISGRAFRTDAVGNHNLQGRELRRFLIDCLARIFPASFGANYQQFVWGVYPTTLTTWSRPRNQNFLAAKTIDNLGTDGLLVCFTDRLTIAPLAADAIEQEISSNLRIRWSSSSIPMPTLPAGTVAIHPEYWRTPGRWVQRTSMLWTQFDGSCL